MLLLMLDTPWFDVDGPGEWIDLTQDPEIKVEDMNIVVLRVFTDRPPDSVRTASK